MLTLSRDEARQLAVRAQLLDRPRPTSLMETVGRLGYVQHDQTRHVAPSAHLVLWSRLGQGFAPEELDAALRAHALVELRGMVRPAEDLALYRAEMAIWPGPKPWTPWQQQLTQWVTANDACRRDLLARLEADGPTPARELPDTCVVPWRSTGWTNDKNVVRLLDFMESRGEVAVVGRRGERVWDLASRVHPDVPVVPLEEALAERERIELRALGIVRRSGAGEKARVEGTTGTWRVDPALLDQPFEGRAALLSPLDRLVFDRKRALDLLGFDYQLEMYKPVAKRRWGYWALPVLLGDRLVGKVDGQADREAGVLRVAAVHEDVALDSEDSEAVQAELEDLASWLDLTLSA